MCRIVARRENDRHELTLTTTSDGLALFALTFTSCVAADDAADATPIA